MVHDGFSFGSFALGVGWVKVLEGHLHNLVLLANVAGARDRKSKAPEHLLYTIKSVLSIIA
jgi:hypothetical protein